MFRTITLLILFSNSFLSFSQENDFHDKIVLNQSIKNLNDTIRKLNIGEKTTGTLITINNINCKESLVLNQSGNINPSFHITESCFQEIKIKENFSDDINFNGKITLWGDTIKRKTDFTSIKFLGKAVMSKTTFVEKVEFDRAEFLKGSSPEFVSSNFEKGVSFNYTVFRDVVYFDGTTFKGEVDFSNAVFTNKVSFFLTKMPDTLILDNIETKEIIDLTQAKFEEDKIHYISLKNTPINKIRLSYTNFQIIIPDKIKDLAEFEQVTNIYGSLLNQWKEIGYVSSYELLDKEYQEFKFTKEPKRYAIQKIPGHILNFLNWAWNDYGYAKVRIWPITIALYFIFLLINYLYFNQLIKVVYPIPEIKNPYLDSNEKSKFVSSFFFTSFVFFGFKLKTELFNLKHPKVSIYIFTQYILGIVCLAYIANFVISSTLIGV